MDVYGDLVSPETLIAHHEKRIADLERQLAERDKAGPAISKVALDLHDETARLREALEHVDLNWGDDGFWLSMKGDREHALIDVGRHAPRVTHALNEWKIERDKALAGDGGQKET